MCIFFYFVEGIDFDVEFSKLKLSIRGWKSITKLARQLSTCRKFVTRSQPIVRALMGIEFADAHDR